MNPCIVILGGGFDPVHQGHIELARVFVDLLQPSQLRLIPTGYSQQKAAYHANPEQRIAMLKLAFASFAKTTSLFIDTQEIERAKLGIPSYSVDTLKLLREEMGPSASLIFVMGADQLQQLQHWKNWRELFHLAHLAVAARPGFQLNVTDAEVTKEFQQRAGNIQQIKKHPYGHTYLCKDLAIDISSTQIRNRRNLSSVPPDVLNYIQQHHLY